jgi:dihydropyrimidine dehydrogenase (NAD+) subunit PreA
MVEVPPELPATTWDEISRQTPEVTEDWDAMQRYRQELGIHIH